MKLSAAIRIGSMTTTQIKGMLCDEHNGRCAIGAALEACNVPLKDFTTTTAYALWPELEHMINIIPMLNDKCNFTREEIADLVEVEENALEAKKERSNDLSRI